MLLNPEEFSITQSKEMGIWPPSGLTADSLTPYIRRMGDNITILNVGGTKGENVYRFFELDTKQKIEMIYCVESDPTNLVKVNLKEYINHVSFSVPESPVNLVSIGSDTNMSETLSKYYKLVKQNGIFCGDNHSDNKVKEALNVFRRNNKIGTPISVAYDCWFWYVR